MPNLTYLLRLVIREQTISLEFHHHPYVPLSINRTFFQGCLLIVMLVWRHLDADLVRIPAVVINADDVLSTLLIWRSIYRYIQVSLCYSMRVGDFSYFPLRPVFYIYLDRSCFRYKEIRMWWVSAHVPSFAPVECSSKDTHRGKAIRVQPVKFLFFKILNSL